MKKPKAIIILVAVLAVFAAGIGLMRGRSTKATQQIASGALRGANVLLQAALDLAGPGS